MQAGPLKDPTEMDFEIKGPPSEGFCTSNTSGDRWVCFKDRFCHLRPGQTREFLGISLTPSSNDKKQIYLSKRGTEKWQAGGLVAYHFGGKGTPKTLLPARSAPRA